MNKRAKSKGTGRAIYCNAHGRMFRGHGITLVLRKLVFNFCAECWRADKTGCEAMMAKAAGVQA